MRAARPRVPRGRFGDRVIARFSAVFGCGLGAAALLASVATGAAPTTADRIALRFEVYGLMGLRVLTLRTQFERNGDRYQVTAEYATSGIAGLLVEQSTRAEARGRLTPDAAIPESFRNHTRRSGTDRHSQVEYHPDGTVRGSSVPPPSTAVPPEATRGTVDNLTAHLLIERQLAARQDCGLSVPVFDGRHRYDIVFTGGRREVLKPEGGQQFAGEAIACNMTRYNRIVEEAEQGEGARQGTLWYAALVPGGDILIPVRMRLRTQIGTVDVYLAELRGRGMDLRLIE